MNEQKTPTILAQTVEETEMPTLLKNSLISNGITEIKQIIALDKFDVKMLNNFGKQREKMLMDFLDENNLSLKTF